MIAELRKESEANAKEIRRVVEEGKKRYQETLARFARGEDLATDARGRLRTTHAQLHRCSPSSPNGRRGRRGSRWRSCWRWRSSSSGRSPGRMFDFSETWQLVINTGTTIITFLMIFLIQNTQNRDTAAMQIKLDELIRATKGAHNALLDLEELEEHDLERMRDEYEDLAADARRQLDEGKSDTEVRETKPTSAEHATKRQGVN